MDAIELLKEDHAKLKAILESIEKTTARTAGKREGLLSKAKAELLMHEVVEESLVYPVLKEHAESEGLALEAYEEHYYANLILKDIEKTAFDDERWPAKFSVFKENIYHHIKEEESQLFKLLKKILDKKALLELGEKIKRAKKQHKKDTE